MPGAFQGGDVALERLPCWVLATRVLVALVHSERFLHVSGRLVDGSHDRTRKRVRALSGVNCAGPEGSGHVFVEDLRHGRWLDRRLEFVLEI